MMAAVTHVCTLDYVAKMLGEDPELLEAIVHDGGNLTYGAIISVHTGPDDTITALTDDGIDELKDMLRDARITPGTWHAFPDDFVNDAKLVARIKDQSPQQQPAGYQMQFERSLRVSVSPGQQLRKVPDRHFSKSRSVLGGLTVRHFQRCRGTLSVCDETGGKHATTQASEANDRARHTNDFKADA